MAWIAAVPGPTRTSASKSAIRAASGSAPPVSSRLYGMDIRHQAELEWHFGYPLVWPRWR